MTARPESSLFQKCCLFTWETDVTKHQVLECNVLRYNLIFELQPCQSAVYIFLYDRGQSQVTFDIKTYVLKKGEKREFEKSYYGSLRNGPSIWSEELCELEKENACASGIAKFGFKISEVPVEFLSIGAQCIPFSRRSNNEKESMQQKRQSLEKMALDFKKLFDDEEGSDVTLKCADRQFNAHRCILSARSFKSDILESQETVIDIDDVTPELLEQMLRYIYSGNVEEMNVETAFELYKVAVRYGVGSLRDHCASFLTENLCQIYACDVLLLADTHTDEQLKNSTMDFMVENCAILRTDQWHKFSSEHHSLGLEVYQKYACKQIRQGAEPASRISFEDVTPYMPPPFWTLAKYDREIEEVTPTDKFGGKPAQSTSGFGGKTFQLVSGSEGQPAVASGAPCSTLDFTENAYKSKSINAEGKNRQSLEKMSLELGKLFDNEKGSDVLLKCGDRQFRAHRCILSARCDVFAAMFRSGMLESQKGVVIIKDVDPEILEWMLRYIYSGKVEELTVETASKLYKASNQYCIGSLKNQCMSFMTENLSQTSACDVLLFANTYDDEQLEKSAMDFMIQNRELFSTYQWNKFCDEHPSLGIKVYRKYVDKQPQSETGLIFKKY